MRLRWLVNSFADPQLRLTPKQRAEVQAAVDARLRGRLLVFTLLVVTPPLLVAVWATGLIDDWLGAKLGVSRSLASLVLIALVVGASWPWAAWAYGRFYTRPYRRVHNEMLPEFRVCERCGYDLAGLDTPAPCPECGFEDATEHDAATPRGDTG